MCKIFKLTIVKIDRNPNTTFNLFKQIIHWILLDKLILQRLWKLGLNFIVDIYRSGLIRVWFIVK